VANRAPSGARRGRRPLPPAAAPLGLGLTAANVENGAIELAFEAREDFITPLGRVLEGCLAAMLHDTVGHFLGTLEPGQFIMTLDLQASAASRVTQS
jgi:hypothetical protein